MNKKILSAAILLAVVIINLIFGLPRLERFSAVDEPYWTYDRVPDFWKAVKAKKWKNTDINDKPGITVALVSGFGLLSHNPLDYKSYREEQKSPEIYAAMQDINFKFRLPIYIASLLALFLFHFLIRRLTNRTVADVSIIFIGLSPIILGISLIINPDSLLWIFLPLSILSYFNFHKSSEKKYLILAGVFLGLSLLTKYVANILFVYFLALIFFNYIFKKDSAERFYSYLRKELIYYVGIFFISAGVYYALFPYTWKHPLRILEGFFLSPAFELTWPFFAGLFVFIIIDNLIQNRILSPVFGFIKKFSNIFISGLASIFLGATAFLLIDVYSGIKLYDFFGVLISPKSGADLLETLPQLGQNLFTDLYSLVFGLVPFAFAGLIYALIRRLRPFRSNGNNHHNFIIFSIIFFIMLYYLASALSGIGATVRYQISLYPLACILAAIGIYEFMRIEKLKKVPVALFYALLLGSSIYSLVSIRPFYFSYASFLLPNEYILNYKDMGDGSYLVAEYLNSLPDPQSLNIWSDKGAVCESFVGSCTTGFSKKRIEGKNFDYVVVSTGRESRSFKLSTAVSLYYDFKKAYRTNDYVYQLVIGNRPENTVQIIKGELLKVN